MTGNPEQQKRGIIRPPLKNLDKVVSPLLDFGDPEELDK